MSTENTNERMGLPRNAGITERLEHFIKKDQDQEAKQILKDLLDNKMIVGVSRERMDHLRQLTM